MFAGNVREWGSCSKRGEGEMTRDDTIHTVVPQTRKTDLNGACREDGFTTHGKEQWKEE